MSFPLSIELKNDCHVPVAFDTGYNIMKYQVGKERLGFGVFFFLNHNIKTFLKFTGDITRMTTKNMATS